METKTLQNIDKLNQSFEDAMEYLDMENPKKVPNKTTTLFKFSYAMIAVGGLMKIYAQLLGPESQKTHNIFNDYRLIVTSANNAFIETGDEEILKLSLPLLEQVMLRMKSELDLHFSVSPN